MNGARRALRATVWIAVFIGVTAAMVAVRERLDRVHVTLAYLLVVQLASAQAGRALGVTIAVLSFLAFNFFFVQPYGTLAVASPLDWLVLVAFLITSIVSAQLLYRARALGAERERLSAAAARAHTLEQSNRMKDETLAMVSHDLRTPLTTIKGLAHEIADGGDERADVIEEEADRLNAFVGKLLDLSRVTMGTAALDIQPNEAEDLLGAAAQQAQAFSGGHELAFRVEPSDSMLFGKFDFVQSLRVLVNLIENAAKYSPPGAPIDVGARRVGQELHFWVADRGPGIASADRERIFEPFYRRGVGEMDMAGAGLGLSIAKGIAEAQGGRLSFASRDGGGSVFTLSVPAIDLNSDGVSADESGAA
ncbi:MAG TPA: ATP-binding protein [Gemmatimonadaceae bacterium]